MVFKKTFLSYFNMVLSAAVFCWLLFRALTGFFEASGVAGYAGPFKMSDLPSLGIVVITVAIFVLLDYIKKNLYNRGYRLTIAPNDSRILTNVGFVALIAFGIYLLYDKCVYLMHQPAVVQRLESMTVDLGSPYNFSGDFPRHIYELFTGFVFSVFSARPVVYLILGTVIYFIAAIFVYFAVKSLLGGFSALMAFASVFAYAYLFEEGFCLIRVQENIMFLIISFVIMLFALTLKLRHDGIMISSANCILFIILGIILGFVSSFYPGMLGLLIPALLMIILDDIDFTEVDKEYENAYEFAINKPLLPALSLLVSSVLGVFCFSFFNRMVHGFTFEKSLYDFLDMLKVHEPSIPGYEWIKSVFFGDYLALTVVILVFAIFASLEVFFVKRDRVSIYVLGIVPLAVVFLFTTLHVNSVIYIFAFMTAIAAAGIKAMVRYEDREIVSIENFEIPEETAKPDEIPQAEAILIDTEETVKVVPAQFEVPIPMPKKHEKKVINYDFDVPEYLMKYDYEIKPGEDFDI